MQEATLHQIQALLEQEQTNLKEPKFVLSLSHDAAVKTLILSLPSVVAALEEEAISNHNPAAEGYVKKMKTVSFFALLSLLRDILPHLRRLLKTFQAAD